MLIVFHTAGGEVILYNYDVEKSPNSERILKLLKSKEDGHKVWRLLTAIGHNELPNVEDLMKYFSDIIPTLPDDIAAISPAAHIYIGEP